MTRSRALSGAALLLGMLCGCKSDQPLDQGRQVFQVTFIARATIECLTDTWDRYLDLNLNNQVDVGVDQKLPPKCTSDADGNGFADCVAPGGVVAVPIPFAVRISIVRAGSSTVQDLTPAFARNNFASYTEQPPVFGQTPARDPEPCGDIAGTCVYGNPRRVPYTNVDALNCIFPASAQIPPANIAGQPYPFAIDVGPGDVIMVEAQASTQFQIVFEFLAITTLDGIPVSPVGTTDSGQGAGAGAQLSFSYTVR